MRIPLERQQQPPQQTASLCRSRRLAESNRCYLSERSVHVNTPQEASVVSDSVRRDEASGSLFAFRLRLAIEDFKRWRSWGQTRRQALYNARVTWRLLR